MNLLKAYRRWRKRPVEDPNWRLFREHYVAQQAWEQHCLHGICQCHPGRARCREGAKLRRAFVDARAALDKLLSDELRGKSRSRVHRLDPDDWGNPDIDHETHGYP